MLMPVLSVTTIGLVVALVAIVRGRAPGAAVVRAVVGAWLGFLAGALPGVILDVVLQAGSYLAIIGHAGAAVGAILATVVLRHPARSGRS